MKPDYDVIIAGAGPAGSALAIILAQSGLAVLLLDAARFPRDKPCGDFVSPKGLMQLHKLGCGDAIEALRSQPIRSSKLYLNRELLVAGVMPELAGLPTHGYALPRKQLDEIIFRQALASGAKAIENCRVNDFEYFNEVVTVRACRDEKTEHFTAKLLVGADGANSAVATAAGMRMKDPRYTLASLRAYVNGLSLPHTLMYFDERFFPGYGWIFPVREGLCNIGVGMVKEPIIRNKLNLLDFYAQFKRLVHRLALARGEKIEIGAHQGWPIRSYGGARKNYFPGGLLIGEAGCFVDPINGEGIPLAFDSAELAAKSIMQAFAGGDFSEMTLKNYERDWRDFFDPDVGVSDLAVSMIRNRNLLPVWLNFFRTMSLTAREDEKYAAITGGVLAGVVPARHAINAEMFVRALAHPPKFWQEVYKIDRLPPFTELLHRGKQWLVWQAEILRQFTAEDSWSRDWLREITKKQAQVAINSQWISS